MGSWIDKADLIDEYGEIDLPFKDDGAGNKIDNDAKIDSSILSSESIVKGYLKKANVIKYDDSNVEIALNAEQINFIRESLLSITRYYYSDNTGGEDQMIVERYKTSIEFLKDIAKGNIIFPVDYEDKGKSAATNGTMVLVRR